MVHLILKIHLSVSGSISHDSNMVVMENDANLVHEGVMQMNMGIPEGWTVVDLENGLYLDENGNQQERIFNDLI